jgi:hypothetical protein
MARRNLHRLSLGARDRLPSEANVILYRFATASLPDEIEQLIKQGCAADRGSMEERKD